MPIEISVIIPVVHSEESLCVCLNALFQQDYPADCYEAIIICAEGRNDIKFMAARKRNETKTRFNIFEHKNIIRSSMRNTGIRFAQAPLIAFLDDDCIPEHNWLKEIINFHNLHPDADIYGNNLTPYFYNSPVYSAAFKNIIINSKLKGAFSGPFLITDPYTIGGNLATGNLAAKKDVLNKLGGFDETLKGLADVELCIRALQAGFRLYACNGMSVTWVLTGEIISIMRKYFNWGFASYLIFRKHERDKAVFVFTGFNRRRHFWIYSPYSVMIVITPVVSVYILFFFSYFYPYLIGIIFVLVGFYWACFYRYFKSTRLTLYYMVSSSLNSLAHGFGLFCGFAKSLITIR